MTVEVYVLKDDVMLCYQGAQDMLSEISRIFLDEHECWDQIYTINYTAMKQSASIKWYYKISWISLWCWFAVTINHFSTTDHQLYLIYIHHFLFNLSVVSHLNCLLKVCCWLHLLGMDRWSDSRICSNCTFHPNCHCLHTDQLPIIQILNPRNKGIVYFHLRWIDRAWRKNFHPESFTKILYQRYWNTMMLLLKASIHK